ncbi:MAG: OmpA family protein [Bacteroidota bacterium]
MATLTPGFISVFIPFSSESGDFDDDGVLDKDDNCPKQAGPPSNNGCPEIDTDEDGVPDAYDDCPNEPGPDTNRGCPEEDTGINLSRGDRDGDGVLDSEDDCPSVPGPASNKGCPYVDSDEDGVLDKDDQCPDVPGTVANNGCPGVTNEIINQLNEYSKSILFDTGKFTINEKSLPAIQYIAEIMKEYPTASFLIEGHVDQVAESSAQYLSLSRARAVNDYLVGLGIDQNRLSVEGFGDSRPIASNLTREGRQQNRRIEIKLLDQ